VSAIGFGAGRGEPILVYGNRGGSGRGLERGGRAGGGSWKLPPYRTRVGLGKWSGECGDVPGRWREEESGRSRGVVWQGGILLGGVGRTGLIGTPGGRGGSVGHLLDPGDGVGGRELMERWEEGGGGAGGGERGGGWGGNGSEGWEVGGGGGGGRGTGGGGGRIYGRVGIGEGGGTLGGGTVCGGGSSRAWVSR
jgi:hypothetical protein